ncbi:hypothetical protein GCM10028827_08460 [Mucilaginibacter myungsuensis]
MGEKQAHPQTISFSTGTQGIGLEYKYSVTNAWGLRVGGNVLPINAKNIMQLSGFHANSSMSGKFANAHLMADITPIKSISFLRVVAGGGYFIQGDSHITVNPTDTYKYGDIVLTGDQVGNLKLNMDWKGFAPYMGFGLAHAFPKNKFNINLDLGTYYLSRPEANIDATGMLSGNATQSGQFQKNVSSYRWYPQVALNFNFKL